MAAEPQKVSATELETSGEKELLMGGFEPIKNIRDSYYQNLGKFAVDEHNKQAGSHLQFQEVISGSSQVVAGANFRLQLRAKDEIISNIYEANIFEDLKGNLYLNSFSPLVLKD